MTKPDPDVAGEASTLCVCLSASALYPLTGLSSAASLPPPQNAARMAGALMLAPWMSMGTCCF